MTEEVTIVAPKLDLLTLSDGPALSSGSDRPVPAVVVDATDTEARPEAKEAEDKATADKEKATADAGDGPKEDKTPPEEKAYITREKNRRKAVEEDLARTRQQLDEALALAHKYAPKQATDQPAPQRDKFEDDNEYIDALATWKAEQLDQQRQVLAQKRSADERQRKINSDHAERMAAAEETDPGITDIAKDPTLPISEAMSAAILTSDAGPAVIRWLDNNRIEAKRISDLHPARAAAEIGKIEATLAAPKAAAPKAPKPITPLGGRNNAGPKTIGEMSSEEWGAHLDAERAKRLAVQRGTQVSVTK